jgi:hypothetical protein
LENNENKGSQIGYTKQKKKEDECCLSKVQTPIEFILKQKIEYYKQNDNTTKHVHEMRYWNILKGFTLWEKF